MNILLTACSGPSAICFAKSLREINDVRLIGVNVEHDAISARLVDAQYIVPFASDPAYLEELKKIVVAEKVDYIIPFVDEEVDVLSKHADTLGAKILVSSHETIRYTGNKRKAYDLLSEYLPRRFEKKNVREYPIFAKPHVGRGGKGAKVVANPSELSSLPSDTYIFQELLSNPEVSVDALFDFDSQLVVAVPRLRAHIDQGISVGGVVYRDTALQAIVEDISKKLVFIGPVNFQFMCSKDGYRLIEINARGGGGTGITIRSGVDIPKLAYELMQNGTVEDVPEFVDGSYQNFDEVIERQRLKRALAEH